MSTSPVISVTDEFVAELERLAFVSEAASDDWVSHDDLAYTLANQCDIDFIIKASPATIIALLVERAELKRDAARSDAAFNAVISYMLDYRTEEPMQFLRCWNEGNFDALRKEWTDAPVAIYYADCLADHNAIDAAMVSEAAQ